MIKNWMLILSLLFILSFCSKEDKTTTSENINQEQLEKTNQTLITQLENFEPSITPKKITSLNLDNFLTIYISFLEDQVMGQKANIKIGVMTSGGEELNNSDSQYVIEEQLKSKESFFKKWGITFEAFDQFSLANSEAIQKFIKSHPAEQSKIEQLDQFLSAIQTSATSQGDEYNFKDEISVLEQTEEQEAALHSNNEPIIEGTDL